MKNLFKLLIVLLLILVLIFILIFIVIPFKVLIFKNINIYNIRFKRDLNLYIININVLKINFIKKLKPF